jgi:bifunctional DNA-binding transcriptional regulator/antitoxin component of YhaV-PrlF toxin-antitoxin module
MIVTLDAKHRLTVPRSLAKTRPGDYFEALYDEDQDAFVFRRIKRKVNWLEVLKQCPVPMDDIPPRSATASPLPPATRKISATPA